MRQWVILLTIGFLSHGNHCSCVSYSFQEELFFHHRPPGRTGKAAPFPANTKQKAGQGVLCVMSHSVVPLVYPASRECSSNSAQQLAEGTRGMPQLIQEYQPSMAALLGFGFTVSISLTTDYRECHKSKPKFLQESYEFWWTHSLFLHWEPSAWGKIILAPDTLMSLTGSWVFTLVLS